MAMKSSIANHQKAELAISNLVLRSSFLVVMVFGAHSVERSIASTLTIPEALANVLRNAYNADGKNFPHLPRRCWITETSECPTSRAQLTFIRHPQPVMDINTLSMMTSQVLTRLVSQHSAVLVGLPMWRPATTLSSPVLMSF